VTTTPLPGATGPAATLRPRRVTAWSAVLLLPMAGFALLLARPDLDGRWQHHPSHFWLVLAAGGLNAVLAYGTGTAARRRGDARVALVSLAFLAAAGFLGLHALATPGVLLDAPNAGFALATPVGLLVAAGFAAWSSADLHGTRGIAVVRHTGALQAAVIAALLLWAAASLAEAGPLADAPPVERASGPLLVLALMAAAGYLFAVLRYLRTPRHPASPLPLVMAAAWLLLAEAAVAVGWGRNWHASWWEWHVLMLAAFVVVAVGAQRSWHEERWVGLYLPTTASARREVSILFADLQGFTAFSERHEPEEVTAMLNSYFTEAVPAVVGRFGGQVDRLVGDALMATFNTRGDQPDHARRAAGAALELQRVTGALAQEHPGWPRFRVGVNTGSAAVGVLGTAGGRTWTVIGDTVNTAARLEGKAPVGGVLVGAPTLRRLPDALAEPVGEIPVKGRSHPVEAHRLLGLGS
jgi:adenylate cyclase